MFLPVDYNSINSQQRKAVREEYLKLQEGLCCHCGARLDRVPHPSVMKLPIDRHLFPRNFFKYPVHLHHNHDTGMTIGAVHCYCNAVLWQYHGE